MSEPAGPASILQQLKDHRAAVAALPREGYVMMWTAHLLCVRFDTENEKAYACGVTEATVFSKEQLERMVNENAEPQVFNGRNEKAVVVTRAVAIDSVLASLDKTIANLERPH